jgi:AcrR family transcriptional regulator
MARPQQISDDDIDAAARAVFLQDGPQASMSLVANRLGVSSAAVFQRVGTKEALLSRALGPGVPETAAALLAGPLMPVQRQKFDDLQRELCKHLLSLLRFLDGTLPSLITLRVAGVDFGRHARVDDCTPPLYLRRCLSAWLVQAPLLGVKLPQAPVIADALLSSLESRALHRYLGGAAFIVGTDDNAFIEGLTAGLLRKARSTSTKKRSSP